MSKFQKSNMTVNGNSVHMSMPFAKIDKEQRLVSGYATLDNLDSQGDVVLAEASAKAFARARGNIREMHQPIAVGKMVDFREDEYYDPDDGQFYRGVFVTAHVSEGAQDTWLKVLDGTLTGFSIGGEIIDSESNFVKEAGDHGRTVRFIKDYDLVELSLVDNPANQLANVLSIQKNATGSVTVKMGEVADTVVENVFMCPTDYTVKAVDSTSAVCPMCEQKMDNIGWFETNGDRAEKVRNIVSKHLSPSEKEAAPSSNSEGGVDMAKSKEEGGDREVGVVNPSEEFPDGTKVEESDETSVPVEDDKSEEVDETAGTEEEEEAEAPEEVADEEESEISKQINKLHEAVEDSLKKSREELTAKVDELEKKLEENTQTVLAKTSELETKVNQYGEKLETSKNKLAEMETRLEKMNSSEAFKKSAELETETAVTKQSDTTWNGAFSGKRSRFSVDNLS